MPATSNLVPRPLRLLFFSKFHYRSQALPQNQQIDGVQDMFPFVPIFDSHPASPFSSHIFPNPPYRFALPPLLFPDTSFARLLPFAFVSLSSTHIRRLSSNPLHCLQSRKWPLPALLPYLKAVTRAGFSDSLSAPEDREHG